MRTFFRFIPALLLAGTLTPTNPALAALVVTETSGGSTFALPTSGNQFSGITHAGGNSYYAISDTASRALAPITIDIDPVSGAIQSGTLAVGTAATVAAGSDLEGVAYNPNTNTVVISDEVGPTLREHALDGSLLKTFTIPPVYTNSRNNLGFESVSRNASNGYLWTANEEALTVDGPVSTTTDGTLVRLQRFINDTAVGQWAYETNPIPGDTPTGTGADSSGVADLLALPNGDLLILERALGANNFFGFAVPFFRSSLYLADFSGATDVTPLSGLSGGGFAPVSKTLLWQRDFTDNFEGITLGPTLNNGDLSAILIADDGHSGGAESLFGLRIAGASAVPTPASAPLFLALVTLLLARQKHRA